MHRPRHAKSSNDTMTDCGTALVMRRIAASMKDSSRPVPAEARLVHSGVTIWAVTGYLPMVDGDIERVAGDYDFDLDAVRTAIAW